ncbi:hypothetical protein ACSQ67_009976 [Phaseolus vulgaris]
MGGRFINNEIKSFVSIGPNSTKFLDPISTSVVSIVDPTKYLYPTSLVSTVFNDISFQGDIKRLVPTSPNSAQSPDPPIKRLVPTSPNPAESPDPTPIKRLVPTGPNSAQSPDPTPIKRHCSHESKFRPISRSNSNQKTCSHESKSRRVTRPKH